MATPYNLAETQAQARVVSGHEMDALVEAEYEKMKYFAPTQDLQEEAAFAQSLIEDQIAQPEALAAVHLEVDAEDMESLEGEAEVEAEAETELETEVEPVHVPTFAELDAAVEAEAALEADVEAFADAMLDEESELEADPVANTTAPAVAANTTKARNTTTRARARARGRASKVISLKSMQRYDTMGFRGTTEEQDKILANCADCGTVNGTVPEFGKTSTGLPCRCEAARRAQRRLHVRRIAREVSTNTTRSLIKQYAPRLYRRVLSEAKRAQITQDIQMQTLDTLKKNATDPTQLDPLAVKDAVKNAAEKAAEQVILKTGVNSVAQNNEKNEKIHVDTAKRIIGQAVEAGIAAGESIAQRPVDSLPQEFANNGTAPSASAAAAPAAAPAAPAAAPALAETESEAEVEVETEAEAEAEAETEVETETETEAEVETETEDAPAAPAAPATTPAPAPPATNQTQAGVSDNERQVLIQQWLNAAAAAPADQKLWEVFQDPKGDQYYYNVITKETTWKAPNAIDQMKRARDFSAEADVPPSWQKWQNNFITAVPEGAKPNRDWCNPYLCKNGRPCVQGTCQCGLMWEGSMCETPSQLARDLRFKELQSSKVVSFAEIERQKAVAEAEAAEKADLAARNVSTEFMPQPALISDQLLMEGSVLGPDGRVNRRDIEGPTIVQAYMPNVVGQADEAMVYYGSPLKVEPLSQDPTRIRLASKLNFKTQIARPKHLQVIAKGSAGLPGVPKAMVNTYIPVAVKPEYNPIYGEIRGFEAPLPKAGAPQTIEFNSNED